MGSSLLCVPVLIWSNCSGENVPAENGWSWGQAEQGHTRGPGRQPQHTEHWWSRAGRRNGRGFAQGRQKNSSAFQSQSKPTCYGVECGNEVIVGGGGGGGVNGGCCVNGCRYRIFFCWPHWRPGNYKRWISRFLYKLQKNVKREIRKNVGLPTRLVH